MITGEWQRVTGSIVDAAMRVHSVLGPGLLEGAYEACLAHELRTRGHRVRTQVPVPVRYAGVELELAYRLDLLVEEHVVVEVKTVTRLLPIHSAQLLSYLKLNNYPVGLLLNFHTSSLRDGIKRLANN